MHLNNVDSEMPPHMKTVTSECSSQELPTREAELKAMGFRLASVRTEKELAPMQYLKRSFHGEPNSFSGEERWTIVRREQ